MISIKNVSLMLCKKDILKDVSAEMEDGKIHGLIGRNGSGKTMLMKCICGFVKPTHGEIKVADQIVGKDVDFPPDIGFIIETPGFIPYYSGYKNLKLLAGIRGNIGRMRLKNLTYDFPRTAHT